MEVINRNSQEICHFGKDMFACVSGRSTEKFVTQVAVGEGLLKNYNIGVGKGQQKHPNVGGWDQPKNSNKCGGVTILYAKKIHYYGKSVFSTMSFLHKRLQWIYFLG